MRRLQTSRVLLALKVVCNAETSSKLKDIRAILKPRIFKFRENQTREIQEVPVHHWTEINSTEYWNNYQFHLKSFQYAVPSFPSELFPWNKIVNKVFFQKYKGQFGVHPRGQFWVKEQIFFFSAASRFPS